MRTLVMAFGFLGLLAGPASADVVHLTNGRRIEGKVVEERRGAVHLEVPGGRVVLPANSVARIERRETPQEEFGDRARDTDMTDPAAVEALAAWASGRGLSDQAEHLRALAQGLRLERRVASIRGSRLAMDWIEVYAWSRGQGASLEVQRWLVAQAAALDPDHPAVRAAQRSVEREHEALEAGHTAAEHAPRPPARADKSAARAAAERAAALEAELAQRELEEQALRERVEQLEQGQQHQLRRRVVRRRANPGAPRSACP
ncbi:MAG: hypothetical protein KF878_33280 [Planctomycetes bacterium]|nr:hypothetical protein [Planctomycetota bacterium]